MKLAITSQSTDLNAAVAPRFGRAPYIIIVDPETLEFEAVENSENVNAFRGAGIQAATMISDMDVTVLLTGYCGPNAFRTLEAAKIKVVNDMGGTVMDAVNTFKAGNFTYAGSAKVEG